MWKCDVCGGINKDDHGYCSSCGEAGSVWVCPECGTANSEGLKCSNCQAEKPMHAAGECATADKIEKMGKIVFVVAVVVAALNAILAFVGVGTLQSTINYFADDFSYSGVTFGMVVNTLIQAGLTVLAGYVLRLFLDALAIITASAALGKRSKK